MILGFFGPDLGQQFLLFNLYKLTSHTVVHSQNIHIHLLDEISFFLIILHRICFTFCCCYIYSVKLTCIKQSFFWEKCEDYFWLLFFFFLAWIWDTLVSCNFFNALVINYYSKNKYCSYAWFYTLLWCLWNAYLQKMPELHKITLFGPTCLSNRGVKMSLRNTWRVYLQKR